MSGNSVSCASKQVKAKNSVKTVMIFLVMICYLCVNWAKLAKIYFLYEKIK